MKPDMMRLCFDLSGSFDTLEETAIESARTDETIQAALENVGIRKEDKKQAGIPPLFIEPEDVTVSGSVAVI